jgi:hypothetical protein
LGFLVWKYTIWQPWLLIHSNRRTVFKSNNLQMASVKEWWGNKRKLKS